MAAATRLWTDQPSLVLLFVVAVLWTGGVLGHILRSPKSGGAKFGWCLGAILFLPVGGLAYYLFARQPKNALTSRAFSYLLGGLATATAIAAVLTKYPPGDVSFHLVWLAAMSVVTFMAYGYDKAVAKHRERRIAEVTLHVFGMAGGFLGAWPWVIFWHKSNWKRYQWFPVLLALASGLHGAALIAVPATEHLLLGVVVASALTWMLSRRGR